MNKLIGLDIGGTKCAVILGETGGINAENELRILDKASFPTETEKGFSSASASVTVRLHIVTEWFAGTADYSPTEQQALEFLDIIDHLVAALQGFSTSYMNGWMRTRSITNHDHERYVDNVEEYTCNLTDTLASGANEKPFAFK